MSRLAVFRRMQGHTGVTPYGHAGDCPSPECRLHSHNSRPDIFVPRTDEGRRRAALKFNDSAHPENQCILQRHPRHVAYWIRRAAARVPDILDVRLQSEATPNFVLVDRGQKRLRRPDRPGRSVQGLEIAIESLRLRRHVRVGDGQAKLVVRPRLLKTDQLQAAVGVEVDEIAVRRRIRCAGEDADAAVVVALDPEELLLEDPVDAVVAGEAGWNTGAQRTSERNAVDVEAFVIKASEMPPSAELEFAV